MSQNQHFAKRIKICQELPFPIHKPSVYLFFFSDTGDRKSVKFASDLKFHRILLSYLSAERAYCSASITPLIPFSLYMSLKYATSS